MNSVKAVLQIISYFQKRGKQLLELVCNSPTLGLENRHVSAARGSEPSCHKTSGRELAVCRSSAQTIFTWTVNVALHLQGGLKNAKMVFADANSR